MRSQANLVIIGAGIVGCSAAYHLSKLGWKDIVVVDQGPLFETGGSTSHAPGLVFQTNGSKMMCEFAQYTVDLMLSLGNYHDGEPVFYKTGGIEVAYTKARMQELKRKHGLATSYGLESHLISPQEVKQHIPILDDSVIEGGYFVPKDGDARAWRAAEEMAKIAIEAGAAEFYGNTKVTDIEVENGRIKAVITENGRIACEQALLCTNIWGPVLAEKVGIRLPMMPVEHQYLISEPLPELAADKDIFIKHPILRHQDYSMYFRQHGDCYGIGSYRHEPLLFSPWDVEKNAMRPFTEKDFTVAQKATNELLPALRGKKYPTKFNGMFVFTIDGAPIMGESCISGLWTAIGVWVTHSGGVGKAIAEWMHYGETETDVREANIDRFHAHHYTQKYIHLRCAQQYREVYDIIHPLQQMENPRNLRLAPYHQRLAEQKGVFFEASGWESAQWYEENARLLEKYDDQIPKRNGWEAMNWSRIQGAEHLAVRKSVGLFNLANFTKITVEGAGATRFLNRLAAGDIDQPVGKVVYTSLLTHGGGIKSDLTITRTGKEKYLVLTGAGGGPHDLAWIHQNAPSDGSVKIEDVTSNQTAIGLWGPNARKVLETLAKEDVSNEAFPYFTAKPLTIDTVPAFALRLSYAGELGWEIYCPTEHGLHLWDLLWEAGKPFDIIAAGSGAFNSLRLEKGYRAWGSDIHTQYNPHEAGLAWAVRMDKGEDFIGRGALQKIKQEGVTRKLCCMTLDDPDGMVLGKEPILDGDIKLGYVTSTDFGYSVGKHILYGYLPIDYVKKETQVEVEYFGKRHSATVTDDPLFDAKMERLKG